MNLGSCYRTETKCTLHDTREGIPTNIRQAKGIIWLCDRATGERIYLPLEESLCCTFLLHQKERWQVKTHAGLPMAQWMDHQKLLPLTIDLWTHSVSSECRNIHQSQCQVGIQQYMHQGRRWVQGGVYHEPRAVWTHCNVLWTNKLSSNLSNNDECIFTPEIAKGWLIVYMDNIFIATRDDPKFHEECVHHVLEKLHLHDLYLKLEKCVFKQWWMEFLGVVLENGTVQMDPAKLKGIADWPQPQCVTDIHAFLGFTGFYCYFMPNYSNITWPLI